jgi:hypothetical protein
MFTINRQKALEGRLKQNENETSRLALERERALQAAKAGEDSRKNQAEFFREQRQAWKLEADALQREEEKKLERLKAEALLIEAQVALVFDKFSNFDNLGKAKFARTRQAERPTT